MQEDSGGLITLDAPENVTDDGLGSNGLYKNGSSWTLIWETSWLSCSVANGRGGLHHKSFRTIHQSSKFGLVGHWATSTANRYAL